jgi:Sulfotransferase family
VSAVYATYAASQGKTGSRWGDKNNFYRHHLAELATLFPSAGFVHIVRDGRDVAASYRALSTLSAGSKYAPRLPTAIAEIAADWISGVRAFREHASRPGVTAVEMVRCGPRVSTWTGRPWSRAAEAPGVRGARRV